MKNINKSHTLKIQIPLSNVQHEVPDDLESLVKEMEHYNNNYLLLKNTVENELQDIRLQKLRELDPEHPLLSVINSDIVEDKPKIRHDIRMLSLLKITDNPEALARWVKKFKPGKMVIRPKLDGHSLSIRYSGGKHVLSVTRGDGKEGNDVTANSKMVKGLLPEINDDRKIEVRGEIIIKNSDFKEISGQFANSRNGISIAHVKDPNEVAERKISFVAYNVFVDGKNILDETAKFEFLKKLGFDVPYYETHETEDLKNPEYVKTLVRSFEKFRTDDNELDYAIDGLVIKANALSEQLELGENDHDPNWAVAWKYLSEEKTTKLKGIEWTVSRNGYLIPVGLLETVELSGTNVSRVTLNNYSFVKNGDIRIGDELVIRKSGEIIPYLVMNNSAEERKVQQTSSNDNNMEGIPSSCPSCSGTLEKTGVHVKCSNPSCSGKVKKSIAFFASALGVEALGEGIVNALYDAGKLEKPSDIFELKESDMEGLEGFGKTLAAKIIRNVNKSKETITPEKLIKSLGIPGLGERIATKLLKKYGSLKNLMETYDINEVMAMDGFGENNTRTYFQGLENDKTVLKSLAEELGLWEIRKTGAVSNRLHGKSFCITGTLSRGRTEMEALVENNSGTNKKDVNKNTDYLILGENGGSKKDKAEKLMEQGSNIKIITESEFLEMLN